MSTEEHYRTQLERARQAWNAMDVTAVRQVGWASLIYFQLEIWRRVSDGAGPVRLVLSLLRDRLARQGREVARGAALVCGDMAGERYFFEDEGVPFDRVDGYDLSQVSLSRYQPKAPLQFVAHVEDANKLQLEPESVDLIVGWHGLHHVQELGNLFEQARRALKPGGLLTMLEWIGPNYLQIPWSNRVVATLLLYVLFPSRRERTTHMGRVKGWSFIQSKPGEFDPSEACNSVSLEREYARHFRTLRADRNGGLTYPMFECIAQNFDQEARWNQVRFRIVEWIEQRLTRSKVIRPLFIFAVGEPRPADQVSENSGRR
jgi:SAM-dependent methyltransferase